MFKNITIILLPLFLLFGCAVNSPGTDSGIVELEVSFENSSKTIMYNLSDEDVKSIRIDFTDGPASSDSITFGINEDISFSLITGVWTISVYGLNESETEIVFAETSVSVSSSQKSQLDLVLKPMMNDTDETEASGSVSVEIDWSGVSSQFLDDVTTVTASFGYVDQTSTDISSLLDIDLSGRVAAFNKTPCPSGNYTIEFLLYNKEAVLIASAEEAVNVRDNLKSYGIIELEDDDFNLSGISIDISVDLPEVEIITFNYSNGVNFTSSEITAGITVSVVNTTVFDNYWWSLYGYSLDSSVSSLVLPTDLASGIHHLTLYADNDGDLLSGTLSFIVEE